jgi:dTDP-4-amino-4,6-dideoxygalactose transaminase
MPDRWREIPPTAGLPLQWRDFLPRGNAESLETALSAFLQVPAVQLECSGTAALVIALTTLKRMSNRRSVVIPAYTCPLVALAVIRCDLQPVVCDLQKNSFELCPQSLEIACNGDTLAIIPTHLGGRVADLDTVSDIAQRHGVWIIEDAAQSLGATYRGQHVATIGDIGFSSLAVGKGLTLYEGGLLVARETFMREALRATSARTVPYRSVWEARRLAQLCAYAMLYRPATLRFAYGMPLRRAVKQGRLIDAVGDDLPTRIPLHRVGAVRRMIGANASIRLPSFLESRSEEAIARKKNLETISGLTVIGDAEGGQGIWPFLIVLMPTERARDAALARLWTAGLGVSRLFIHALPDYPRLGDQFGAPDVSNARDFAARTLTISNSHWLREPDFLTIRSVLADVIDTWT